MHEIIKLGDVEISLKLLFTFCYFTFVISVINPITLLSRGGKTISHHLKGDNHSHCDFSWNLTTCTVHVKNNLHVYE
jgi:hypothetical protein